jgi:hypothetical protein
MLLFHSEDGEWKREVNFVIYLFIYLLFCKRNQDSLFVSLEKAAFSDPRNYLFASAALFKFMFYLELFSVCDIEGAEFLDC